MAISATTASSSVVLAPGESVVTSAELAAGVVLFFMHSTFVLTERRIVGEGKNTFFGIIPVGTARLSYPLANVASVATSTRVNLLGFLVGAAMTIVSLNSTSGGDSNNVATALFGAAVGLVILICSFQAAIAFTNNAGHVMKHNIAIWEKGKGLEFANQVNTAVAARS